MMFDQSLHPGELSAAEPSAALQANWFQAILRDVVVSLDVNVGGLVAVARVEVKPVRAFTQYGGH